MEGWTNLVNSVDGRRESSMYTEDTIVNDGRQTQIVKDLTTVSPDIGRSKLLEALVVESIDLCNLSRFVVATNESNPVWVSDLISREKSTN